MVSSMETTFTPAVRAKCHRPACLSGLGYPFTGVGVECIVCACGAFSCEDFFLAVGVATGLLRSPRSQDTKWGAGACRELELLNVTWPDSEFFAKFVAKVPLGAARNFAKASLPCCKNRKIRTWEPFG